MMVRKSIKLALLPKVLRKSRFVDFHETFSPTAKLTSIRLLVNLAINENLIIHSMDVKSAYLNAELDCDVYIRVSTRFS